MPRRDEFFERAETEAKMHTLIALSPTWSTRQESLAELRILDLVMDCPPAFISLVADGDDIIQRIWLRKQDETGPSRVALDLVEHADGSRHTVVNMSELGKGVYTIDPQTGETTRRRRGKERRVTYIGKRALAGMLEPLMYAVDRTTGP